jgi:hypothetical protein
LGAGKLAADSVFLLNPESELSGSLRQVSGISNGLFLGCGFEIYQSELDWINWRYYLTRREMLAFRPGRVRNFRTMPGLSFSW